MKFTVPAASLFALLVAAPALAASCDEELAGLDKRVTTQATEAVATASGGQGVAAKREGEAKQARDTQTAAKTEAKGPAGGAMEAQATAGAAQAGGGGDRVMQAKVSINEARVAKGKGDEAGCLAGVAKAKGQLAN